MPTFILVLILCTVSSCLLVYGINTATLWKEYTEIREPSIRDLEDTGNIRLIEQYLKEEIQTYQNYRTLEAKIKKYKDDGISGLFILSAPVVYWYTIAETIKSCFVDFSGFWAYVISIVITFVIVALPLKIISKVFPPPMFDMTRRDLLEEFEASGAPSAFPVSDGIAFENFIRSRHHWFLFSIRNIEQTRYILRIIGCVLMLIALIISASRL